MSITELIARLEKATGPDREIDIAIFETVVAVPNEGQLVGVEPRQWDPKFTPLLVPHPKWGFSPAVPGDAEYYTSSVDAALSLIPKTLAVSMRIGPASHGAKRIASACSHGFDARAPSLPLALCLAALKARAAS